MNCRKQLVHPGQVSADFVAHMEDVLELYAEPYDPQRTGGLFR